MPLDKIVISEVLIEGLIVAVAEFIVILSV